MKLAIDAAWGVLSYLDIYVNTIDFEIGFKGFCLES
jgi:hypothetical protein